MMNLGVSCKPLIKSAKVPNNSGQAHVSHFLDAQKETYKILAWKF
jgi:hypothetical protein